jgi:hypothetical protein
MDIDNASWQWTSPALTVGLPWLRRIHTPPLCASLTHLPFIQGMNSRPYWAVEGPLLTLDCSILIDLLAVHCRPFKDLSCTFRFIFLTWGIGRQYMWLSWIHEDNRPDGKYRKQRVIISYQMSYLCILVGLWKKIIWRKIIAIHKIFYKKNIKLNSQPT